jgi:hypothetical protein
VKFNAVYYPVKKHVHTHPDYYGGKIGLSGSPEKVYGDYQLLRDTGLDYINVLFNGKIHQVEYNSHIKDWKFINIWIWY